MISFSTSWCKKKKTVSSCSLSLGLQSANLLTSHLAGLKGKLFLPEGDQRECRQEEETTQPAYPSVGAWEQLHCFLIRNRGGLGGKTGSGTSSSAPGQAGATTGSPKIDFWSYSCTYYRTRNSGVAPTRQRRGRRQWRQPLNFEFPYKRRHRPPQSIP